MADFEKVKRLLGLTSDIVEVIDGAELLDRKKTTKKLQQETTAL